MYKRGLDLHSLPILKLRQALEAVNACFVWLQVSHAVQHSSGATAPGLGKLAMRSYLGSLLPESLLYILETYGPGSFATALAGDTDNPEIIWTHRMRGQRLIPQVW